MVEAGDEISRLWMQGGMLMGARFDAAINGDTDDFRTSGTATNLAIPVLSSNDPDTAANELRTHLIMTGSPAEGTEGMFSMSDLLGSGMASDEGSRFVDGAVDTVSKVRSDVAALLTLATPPAGLESILATQWDKLEMALDTIFATDSDAATDPAPAVRTSGMSSKTYPT